MRLAMDGLPRELPLSSRERDALAQRVKQYRPIPRSVWVAALMPSLLSLPTLIAVVVGRIWISDGWWIIAVGLLLMAQMVAAARIMNWLIWPHTHRAMAAAGYEVCIRCAFPLAACPHSQCPECGTPRIAPPTPPPSP